LYIGNLFLAPFDPTNLLYIDITNKNSSYDALKTQLKIGKNTSRFVVPYSHYPLICNGAPPCPKNFKILQKHFDLMLHEGCSLYIGAHSHSYERIYPYQSDQTFAKLDGPYKSNGGYLLSIV